jgi:protein O-mannosyl-transferase
MRHRAFVPALLACALLVAAAAYWPGLHGPFVFDDDSNFSILKPWLAGLIGWRDVVFGVNSGPGGRPLAIASFMLSAWMGGLSPFPFKAGNLALHLLNGVLVYALAVRLAHRDRTYAPYVEKAALVLAAAWLLHPLLVSTVLYAVQRMAVLSTTFMLLGLLSYCRGRLLVETGYGRPGSVWLFLLVPTCTLLAAAAKENGLILPALCAVVEFCYFRPGPGIRRPKEVRLFFLLTVAFPGLFGLALFAFRPDLILGGYQDRPFTPVQRLLTEARVVWDYAANILLPYGPRMSLYRDNYPVSTGLLSPLSTSLALLGWIAAIGLAVRWRVRLPAVLAGLSFYLVGHLVESTIVPLLLYFEHRNYLPAFGILWAAGALLLGAAERVAPYMSRPRLVFGTGLILLLLGFGLATHGRAWVWSTSDRLLDASLKANPGSRWARMDAALTALKRTPIDSTAARIHYTALQAQPDPISRQIGAQGQVVVDCGVDAAVAASRLEPMFAETGRPIEPDQVQMLELLVGTLLRTPCAGLPPADLASRLGNWLDESPTKESSRMKKNPRFLSSQLWLAAGNHRAALRQAMISWNAGARELPLAALMIETRISLGERQQAKQLLEEVGPLIPANDRRAIEVFGKLRHRLANAHQAN